MEAAAGLQFDYQFVSISRLELLLSSKRPGCTITLLRTPEREKMKINYIIEHADKTLLTLYQRSDDQRRFTLENLKSIREIKIATNTPAAVDALKKIGVKSELLFSMNSMVRMLLLKRMDGIVASNLAIEKMDEFKTGKIIKSVLVKTLVHGVGCSAATPSEYISRLKKASKIWTLE